jgi:glucose/arabinose dehydrogenase
MGELARRSRGIAALIVAAVALVGGGAGAACRYTSLDCHIRSDDGWDLRNVQAQRGGPVTIAASLAKTQVVGRLDLPTDFDFLPDGRILVATRDGLIQLVDPRTGAIAPRPVLDLRDDVSTREFRGLVALVVEPGSTGPTRFYVVYALRNGPKAGPTAKGPTTARVSRFTLRGNIADRDSERIIIGRVAGGSCTEQQASDCLPSEVDHIGADILFRDDGTLLIATGRRGRATCPGRRHARREAAACRRERARAAGQPVLGRQPECEPLQSLGAWASQSLPSGRPARRVGGGGRRRRDHRGGAQHRRARRRLRMAVF